MSRLYQYDELWDFFKIKAERRTIERWRQEGRFAKARWLPNSRRYKGYHPGEIKLYQLKNKALDAGLSCVFDGCVIATALAFDPEKK